MSEHNKDIDGNLSSKRVWGSRFLYAGMVLGIILFAFGLYGAWIDKEIKYDMAIEVWWTFMVTGGGLLGFTLAERFGKTKGTK